MNNRWPLFFQAIRGPILLITIGVLFAVQQAGVISIARTWPLIIIVVGLMKLAERLSLGQQTPVPPYAGGPNR